MKFVIIFLHVFGAEPNSSNNKSVFIQKTLYTTVNTERHSMCQRTHFARSTLPYQSFGRPFNPAASLWHWLFSSWEQQVFIGFGISRKLVVARLTFNSEVPAKAVSSPSLTWAIN